MITQVFLRAMVGPGTRFYVHAETQSYVIKLSCSPYLGIGGGVLLYVSEDLKAESVPVLNSHDFEDSIWCKVRISPSKTVADIDDTEVIWIAFIRDTQINWFYLKIEQNKNNINNYTYK